MKLRLVHVSSNLYHIERQVDFGRAWAVTHVCHSLQQAESIFETCIQLVSQTKDRPSVIREVEL